MPFDSSGQEILGDEECQELLATAQLGRIVFTHAALPAVQPVNFTMAGQHVIIRIAADSKLAAAVRDAIVAFEIDEFDPVLRSGWSVVLVGHARRVTDTRELTALRELPLHRWTPDRRDDFIRITPEIVTGRRVCV